MIVKAHAVGSILIILAMPLAAVGEAPKTIGHTCGHEVAVAIDAAPVSGVLLNFGKQYGFAVRGDTNLVGEVSLNRTLPLNLAIKEILRGQSYSLSEAPRPGCPGETRVTMVRIFPPGADAPERVRPAYAEVESVAEDQRVRPPETVAEERKRLGKRKSGSRMYMSDEEKYGKSGELDKPQRQKTPGKLKHDGSRESKAAEKEAK